MAENKTENDTIPEPSLVEVKIDQPKKLFTTLGREGQAQLEELFLTHVNKFQMEQGGRLPGAGEYSLISLGELREIVNEVAGGVLDDSNNTDLGLEKSRTKEAAELIGENSRRMGIVRVKEDVINPLGEVGQAELFIFSDFHFPPSMAKAGNVGYAFDRGYRFERWARNRSDEKKQKGRFPLPLSESLGEDVTVEPEKVPENLLRRYIMYQDSLVLLYDWMGKEILSKPREFAPILFSLGDLVEDGAFFIDQLAENSNLFGLIESQKNSRLLCLYGNHDEPYYVPESLSMLTALYGHRIFVQEIGGVVVYGIDTNLLNPVWVKEMKRRARDSQVAKCLEERQSIQETVLKRMVKEDRPGVLMGHSPTHTVKCLSELLRQSNVQKVVAGHTHVEEHLILPFRNKSGEDISLDVISSFGEGEPRPRKIYRLKLAEGKISLLETWTEPQTLFDQRFNDKIVSSRDL